MCNHHYRDYESLRKDKDKQYCSLNELINNLPIDKDGLCIFHSPDIEWKSKQDFVQWLMVLKNTLIENKMEIKFQDFHFIAENGKEGIDYLELLSEVKISNCYFHHKINAENICITGNLDFINCTFLSVIDFSDCHFKGNLSFSLTHIGKHTKKPFMFFQKCIFDEAFEFVNNPEVNMNFNFRVCTFDIVEFNVFYNEEKSGRFEFTDCYVNDFSMKECIIYCADFQGTTFSKAIVENVSFRNETIFNEIKVTNNLNFIGRGYKIFEGATDFNVDFETMQGQIYFENANLSVFHKTDKERLLDYERRENGKIQIGVGCIKYRILSSDYTYPLKGSHQYLISEIGHSFATFFTQYNGFNLGVEVRSKTKRSITLYYFTDDDIDKKTFIQMLEGTSGRIFGVVPTHIRKETSSRQDALINYQIDLTRSITKIAYLMQKHDWKPNESKTFFSALTLSPNIHLDEKATHTFLQSIDVNDFLKAFKNIALTVNQTGDNSKFIGFVNTNKIETDKAEN